MCVRARERERERKSLSCFDEECDEIIFFNFLFSLKTAHKTRFIKNIKYNHFSGGEEKRREEKRREEKRREEKRREEKMNIEELVGLVQKAVNEDENENEERAVDILTQLESTPIEAFDFTSAKFAACGKSISALRKKAKSELVKRKAKECKDAWTKIIVSKSSNGTDSKTPPQKKTTKTTTETTTTTTAPKSDENIEEKKKEKGEEKVEEGRNTTTENDEKSALEQVQRTIASKIEQTNNATRDRSRDVIAYGLALAHCEGNCEDISVTSLARIVEEVEDAMSEKWKDLGKEYKAKLRQLAFNMKDPKNPDLRRAIAKREIDATTLIDLSSEELGSDERRAANQSIREHAEAEAVRGQRKEASTTAFKCGKCGQRACTFYQLQTRSADEPMTTFVTCVNCENRWKFC